MEPFNTPLKIREISLPHRAVFGPMAGFTDAPARRLMAQHGAGFTVSEMVCWIMFNVYPQRATDPNDMDRVPDRALCDENLRWLQAVLAETEPTMWAAWGTLIEKRDYLPGLMREMVALTRERDIPWVTFGKRSKKGHPHHPLYLRKDSTPEPFDVENYLDTCF